MAKDDMSSKVCIIVPTYNEADNIRVLIGRLFDRQFRKACRAEDVDLHVLVVDDNSPDGTADVVRVLQSRNKSIHLLLREEKNGLGAAYLAGMRHALRTLEPDIIFEMDADLSHDPKYVMPMIREVKKGADFVIGSRYVPGGSTPDDWGMKRLLMSKSANIYAKTLLGISEVKDCTGGFRAIRAEVLSRIDFTKVNTKGYAFQLSLLELMRKEHAVFAEVPIAFKDRTRGTSKMRIWDMTEVGLFVLRSGFMNLVAIPSHSTARSRDAKAGEGDTVLQAKQENTSASSASGGTTLFVAEIDLNYLHEEPEITGITMCVNHQDCWSMTRQESIEERVVLAEASE